MQKATYFHTSVGEKLVAQRQFDKFVVKLLNSEEAVGHLPCRYSRISSWYFLTYGRLIAVEWRNEDSMPSDVQVLQKRNIELVKSSLNVSF